MANGSAGRGTLSRYLQVLAAFDVDAAFLTTTGCATRAGLPISTAHRLLGDLAEQGLVERLPDRTWRLGLRLWEIACRTPGALGLREIALPSLQRVQQRIGQHTQLAVLDGSDVLFLERLSAPDAVVNATLVGGRLPAALSSSGHVLLAAAAAEDRDAVLHGPPVRRADGTVVGEEELRRVLHETRARGDALARGWIHPDAAGIAVAVPGATAGVVAAVGVVVPADEAAVGGIVAALQGASREIAEGLRRATLPSSDPDAAPGGRLRQLVHSSASSMTYLERRRARRGREVAASPGSSAPSVEL